MLDNAGVLLSADDAGHELFLNIAGIAARFAAALKGADVHRVVDAAVVGAAVVSNASMKVGSSTAEMQHHVGSSVSSPPDQKRLIHSVFAACGALLRCSGLSDMCPA